MIESLVNQLQAMNRAKEDFGEVLVPSQRTADSVAGPEQILARLEQRIALPFESTIVRHWFYLRISLPEPILVMRHFGRPLRDAKPGRHKDIFYFQTGIRRKTHVRQVRNGFHDAYFGSIRENPVQ